MAHEEYLHIAPGAQTAVLFLHGIVGSPEHFRKLIDLETAVPAGVSVHSVRYPGHGGKVTDFGSSRLKHWRAYAKACFQKLADTHEQIIVVGHSMGTLFAMQLAMEFPEKIPCIFLLQCPMQVSLRFFGVLNLLRIPFNAIRSEDPMAASMGAACGVEPSPCVWLYFPWIFRVLELFAEIAATKKRLPELKVPAVAFQSRKDELVSNRSARILGRNSRIKITEMVDCTHFYYTPEAKKQMLDAFRALF